MQKQPETVKDELRVFLGSSPRFREIEDYLPTQQGRGLSAGRLELRQYQQEALDALEEMRRNRESIALLYHATDYELVDVFDWQEEAAGMISQMEFVRREKAERRGAFERKLLLREVVDPKA